VGSIPSVALALRQLQAETPDPVTRFMQMRQQDQQYQVVQQQIQATQRKQQEGELIRQAFVRNDGDIDKTIAEASKNPIVSPDTLQALQLHSADLKQKRATANDAELKLHATQVDNLRGLFKPVYDMPADTPSDQLEATYQRQRALALKSPQSYGIVDPTQVPEHFPGKQQGETMMASMTGESKQLEEENKRREAANKERELSNQEWKEAGPGMLINTRTGETKGQLRPQSSVEDERYRQIQQKINMRQPVTQDDLAWAKGYEKQKTLGPTVIAAAAGGRQENTQNFDVAKDTFKRYDTALDADQRLSRMEAAYGKAVKGDQQAMLSLLTDHIGMTLGLQKGARITKDILNEAQQSQPWLAQMEAKFESRGYLSGVTLGKDQMSQMLDLGYEARDRSWGSAQDATQMYGVQPPKGAQAIFSKRKVGEKPALTGTLPNGNGRVIDKATAMQFYEAAGRDPQKAQQLATQNGWKVQ